MSNNNQKTVDFSSITKEEVIAYFAKENADLKQKNSQLEQEAKIKARDIKRLDRKSKRLEDNNKALKAENKKLERKLDTIISVTIDSVNNSTFPV